MQFTRFTNYSLKVLVHLAQHPDSWITIRQISESYNISQNHLMKVVSFLSRSGYLQSRRGPGGGVKLKVDACNVQLADVIVAAEGGIELLHGDQTSELAATRQAGLHQLLDTAVEAFIQTLNGSSLADIAAAGQAVTARS